MKIIHFSTFFDPFIFEKRQKEKGAIYAVLQSGDWRDYLLGIFALCDHDDVRLVLLASVASAVVGKRRGESRGFGRESLVFVVSVYY